MSMRLRMVFLAALVAVFGFGAAGSAGAAQPSADCVEDVMDLPALNVCKDAQGRHILNLPTMELREDLPKHHDKPAPAVQGERHLPKTGLHTEDFAAMGMAALAGGAVLLRRVRLAMA